MAFHAFSLSEMAQQAEISAVDVVRLQDALTFDGPVSETEALGVFAIEYAPNPKHASWKGFFIDAIAEYAIHHSEPHGYLTALKADWLLRTAAPQGRILSQNTFELLTTLVSMARWVPERLVSALLDEVYCAIAAGDGPLRGGSATPAGTITERDCDVIRHILYAAGSNGHGAITRAEAEGLLAINASITANQPHPAWSELFGKAIADAALTASGRTGPVREVLLRPDATGSDPHALLSSLRRGMARYRPQTAEDCAIAGLERQRVSIITGDDVRQPTAPWLADVLTQLHQPKSAAAALLFAALSERSSDLDGVLQPLMEQERATRAA